MSSFNPLYVPWALSFMAALWFISIGLIRWGIWHTGQVDHTRGMRNVARTILGLGVGCLVVFGILTVVVLL